MQVVHKRQNLAPNPNYKQHKARQANLVLQKIHPVIFQIGSDCSRSITRILKGQERDSIPERISIGIILHAQWALEISQWGCALSAQWVVWSSQVGRAQQDVKW